jgi:D-glycero-D-manno-heptose 1,7-bisphosphate phosphatase
VTVGKPDKPAKERITAKPAHRAVFLDRDGVINRACVREGVPHAAASLDEFEILPGVVEACGKLKQAGFLLVVVTNQPDVGRGTLKQEIVDAIHARMCQVLPIDRVEVSYDSGHEVPPSELRKPRPGMLLRAARDLCIDLSRSFMVGDRWRDIDCGHAAGCTTILIDYHYTEPMRQPPHHRVKSLLEAVDMILDVSRQRLV